MATFLCYFLWFISISSTIHCVDIPNSCIGQADSDNLLIQPIFDDNNKFPAINTRCSNEHMIVDGERIFMTARLSRLAGALLLCFALVLTHSIEANQKQTGEKPMKTAEGTFNISMQPQEDAYFAVGRLTIDKEYSGVLVATGKGQMLSHRSSTQGSAGYVAIEYVSGSLDGKEGSFVLQHSGQMSAELGQQLTISIIPDSGDGELSNIAGSLEIEIKDGQHFYILQYSL